VALVCPHCGAPNIPAQRAAERRKPKYWGAIAIVLAVAAWAAPYFAAVFLAPIALVTALFAIARNEAIAGIVAIAITAFAGVNILSTAQRISAANAELQQISDKLQRDLNDIQRRSP
jgi:membrane protein implicated in regulation of membrane protease activity